MVVWWPSIAVFLVAACQLTAGEWTFSLRISSARCGNAAPCDGYILAVCLRPLGTVRADGHSCYLFIAGTANELMERDLTSLDEVNSTLMRDGRPYVTRSFPYRGGVQLYIVVLTKPDLPPFNTEEDMVDEVFVDLERTPGGGECSTVDVVGLRGRLSATISLTVDCYAGYGGDDCSCSADDATCESTEVTANICGTTPTLMTLSPTSSPPPAPNKPTSHSNPTSKLTSKPTPTTGSAPTVVGALNSTEASGESSILVPVAASGGGLVLVLAVLMTVVTIVLVYRRRRHRKMYRLDLSALTVDSPKFSPTIPPNDVVGDDDGVTYTTVVNTGYHNEEEKVDLSQLPKSENGGLVYADLDHNSNSADQPTETGLKNVKVDHEQPTYSTFRTPGNKKPEPETLIQYSVVRKQQPQKYVNVPRPKPRKNMPQTEQNLYSIVPPGAHRAPTNQ